MNKRICVVDLSVGKDPSQVLVLVNPVVVDAQGAIRDEEGCLSRPDFDETVERPEKVTIEAQDERGMKRALDGRDLLARAFCHEIDHLRGRLFVEYFGPVKRQLLQKKYQKQARG